MNFKGKDVLGVHVQGDQKFSMYKQWGHGDERLVPIYAEYENMIIRWVYEIMNSVKEHIGFVLGAGALAINF